ncbi:MAG: hypothetical protein ACI8P3_001974 [Saprospiraceae bacterium]|jgi:hypothetical protein
MLKIPEHLNDEQKEAYKKAWLATFDTLMSGLKLIVLLIVGLFLYIPFGKHFSAWFETKPTYQSTNTSLIVTNSEEDPDKIENGIHVQTGLIYATGFDQVRAHCTVCHSAKLVTQNRATKEGWEQMIQWMQATQGLWDLGANQDRIIDYLATNYAPEQKGRRENLNIEEVEWYILNLKE